MHRTCVLALAFVTAAACAADDDPTSPSTPNSPSSPAAPDGAPSTPDADDVNESSGVPAEADALFEWLQAGTYKTFPAEPSAHASSGPHGGDVRVFVNPELASSLADGATDHPVGSAAVKELINASGVYGWAVEVKVADDAGGGDNWYWYENFSTQNNNPVADGTGASICTGCHAGGMDYVTSFGPFVSASDVPPAESDELFAWLQDGLYAAFPSEPEVHPSGVHGSVRVFVNQQLVNSLAAESETHPVGAAAVKEIHNSSGLRGWAVEVKVAENEGAGGDNWYWYENFSTVTNDPVANGTGVGGCAGCHAQGADYVTTFGPFE